MLHQFGYCRALAGCKVYLFGVQLSTTKDWTDRASCQYRVVCFFSDGQVESCRKSPKGGRKVSVTKSTNTQLKLGEQREPKLQTKNSKTNTKLISRFWHKCWNCTLWDLTKTQFILKRKSVNFLQSGESTEFAASIRGRHSNQGNGRPADENFVHLSMTETGPSTPETNCHWNVLQFDHSVRDKF